MRFKKYRNLLVISIVTIIVFIWRLYPVQHNIMNSNLYKKELIGVFKHYSTKMYPKSINLKEKIITLNKFIGQGYDTKMYLDKIENNNELLCIQISQKTKWHLSGEALVNTEDLPKTIDVFLNGSSVSAKNEKGECIRFSDSYKEGKYYLYIKRSEFVKAKMINIAIYCLQPIKYKLFR